MLARIALERSSGWGSGWWMARWRKPARPQSLEATQVKHLNDSRLDVTEVRRRIESRYYLESPTFR